MILDSILVKKNDYIAECNGSVESSGVYLRAASPCLMERCQAIGISKNTDREMKTDLTQEAGHVHRSWWRG